MVRKYALSDNEIHLYNTKEGACHVVGFIGQEAGRNIKED